MVVKGRLNVICHQIRSPENLGAIARLMANFGFSRLVLSDPLTYGVREAEKLAVKAEAQLDAMRLCRTLPEALASSVYACGTTSRTVRGRKALSPRAAVERLAEASAQGEVALVFGGEKRGLSDEELSHCQDVLVIPTTPAQPSLNLSQA